MTEKRWRIERSKQPGLFGIGADISIDGVVLPVTKWHLERDPYPEAPGYMVMTVRVLMDDIELAGDV